MILTTKNGRRYMLPEKTLVAVVHMEVIVLLLGNGSVKYRESEFPSKIDIIVNQQGRLPVDGAVKLCNQGFVGRVLWYSEKTKEMRQIRRIEFEQDVIHMVLSDVGKISGYSYREVPEESLKKIGLEKEPAGELADRLPEQEPLEGNDEQV